VRSLAWVMTKKLDSNTGGFAEEEGDDTIELELSADQVLMLSRADTLIRSNSLPVPSTAKSLSNVPEDQYGGWPAVILLILVVSILSGGIAYLGTSPAQPVHFGANAVVLPAAPDSPAPASADNTAVRFTNPFDGSEVFEFPSGTSEAEVQQAVADLLLKRAHDRQNFWSKTARQRKKNLGLSRAYYDNQSRSTQLMSVTWRPPDRQ
jgi:hypothetical protein